MTLHLLSLPHTITHPRFSSCAFTGKVLRFSPMLRSVGYSVTHYGVEGAESGANEQVDVLSYHEWELLGGREPSTTQYGVLADVGTVLYRTFNERLIPLLRDNYRQGDIICLPFGHAHRQATDVFPHAMKLETGIGYPISFCDFRVYESNAWMHYHLGKEQRLGSDYWWVIPNYYDPKEWALGDGAGGYLLYFGRLNKDKGLNIVWEIAKARPDLKVVLCGQGDPKPWTTLPNIEYRPPIHGAGRSELLGGALATLTPSRYVEPFGGVAVESMLCGTPALGSTFGAYTETLVHGVTGFRCRTLSEWLNSIERVEQDCVIGRPTRAGQLSRTVIRDEAIARYSMWALAYEYDAVLRQLADLSQDGWYTKPSAKNRRKQERPATV